MDERFPLVKGRSTMERTSKWAIASTTRCGEKRLFAPFYALQTEHLPRQARDKCMKSWRMRTFLQDLETAIHKGLTTQETVKQSIRRSLKLQVREIPRIKS